MIIWDGDTKKKKLHFKDSPANDDEDINVDDLVLLSGKFKSIIY